MQITIKINKFFLFLSIGFIISLTALGGYLLQEETYVCKGDLEKTTSFLSGVTPDEKTKSPIKFSFKWNTYNNRIEMSNSGALVAPGSRLSSASRRHSQNEEETFTSTKGGFNFSWVSDKKLGPITASSISINFDKAAKFFELSTLEVWKEKTTLVYKETLNATCERKWF